MKELVTLAHGSGAKKGQELLQKIFLKHFTSQQLKASGDGAILDFPQGKLVTSTDGHVVSPLFFPGGDIGKLAVCGTVNDICAMGARPLYLTASFILEEGFSFDELEKVVITMAKEANQAGVSIVAGDTKVVERDKADKLFITTTGIGVIENDEINISPDRVEDGDKVIVTGTMGDHGATILAAREELSFEGELRSDCATLYPMLSEVLKRFADIHVMRDPTRGGLISCLYEIAESSCVSFVLEEDKIPLNNTVRGLCEILGLEPWNLANEGKMILICPSDMADEVVKILNQHPLGKQAAIIGEAQKDPSKRVYMRSPYGPQRLVSWPNQDPLPRIC